MRYVNTVSMPYDEWLTIPNNPWQRNTEEQARKAHRNHLRPEVYNEEAGKCVVLAYVDDVPYKVDGHTRIQLMEQGKLPKTPSWSVRVFQCDTHDELRELYYQMDTNTSQKTTKHVLQGVLKGLNLEIQSTYLKNGNCKTALAVASGNKNLHLSDVATGEVNRWKDEFLMMDELKIPFKTKGWNHDCLAACLLSLRHWGRTANENGSVFTFWEGLINNQGAKMRGQMDAVQAAYEAQMRYNTKNRIDLCGILLSCVVAHMEGRWYTQAPRPSNLKRFRKRRSDWSA